VLAQRSRDAVAATKSMLNERFGSLLAEAMDRETYHCVRLFDDPDARAALGEFAERRRA
jgi:enoyl-CoA hydratase/carnithine racemase